MIEFQHSQSSTMQLNNNWLMNKIHSNHGKDQESD